MALYFDDLPVGRTDRFGHYAITREEALAFAHAYDPQGFHTDDEAAAASPIFGRLAVSGWQTGAMTMRMIADYWRDLDIAAMGASGLDELRWFRPVYPDDELHCESEILETRVPRSRPDLGFVKVRTTTFNQKDEPVMLQIANVMVARAPTKVD